MNQENYMHIIIPSSSHYVPYLEVLIVSALCNKNNDDKLFFHILSEDIKEYQKKELKNLKHFGEYDIEFLKMDSEDIKDIPVCKAFFINNLANYKLKVASIFKNLDKALIMEVDMIVQSSLKDLYNFNMGGASFVAVKDPWCEELQPLFDIPKEYRYCNTGMFLANLKLWREKNIEKIFFENIKKYGKKLIFPDQDIFNITFYKETKYLPQKWNVYSSVPYTHKNEQEEAFLDAERGQGIIHYASDKKPWFYPESKFADIWWSYARKTPFYELILKRMIEFVTTGNVDYKISAVKNYRKNILNYWKYKILRNFVFGKTRQRYITKKAILKDQIRQAKQFRK